MQSVSITRSFAICLFLPLTFGACRSTSLGGDEPDIVVTKPQISHLSDSFSHRLALNEGYSGPLCDIEQDRIFRDYVVMRINRLRQHGAMCGKTYFPPVTILKWNERLFHSSFLHSLEMAQANLVTHRSLDDQQLGDRLRASSYVFSAAAENVAAGQKSLHEVMDAWEKSPKHCVNMMRAEVDELGVSCVRHRDSFYQFYWTMNLAKEKILPTAVDQKLEREKLKEQAKQRKQVFMSVQDPRAK